MASYRRRHEADAGTASELIAARSRDDRALRATGWLIRLRNYYRGTIVTASAGAPPAGRRRRSFAGRRRRQRCGGLRGLERRCGSGGKRARANRNGPASAFARGAGAAGRGAGGVSADTLGRRFCSAGLVSAALASEALARSRAIWAWLALSCAMVAFSSSTCWPIVARSCAIDCNWAGSEEGAGAAGAAQPWRRVRAVLAARRRLCRGRIDCVGLNGGRVWLLGDGRRGSEGQCSQHEGRRPFGGHRLGLIAIVLPGGGGHDAAKAQ